jgi:membrane associated rhomboid family serine protease
MQIHTLDPAYTRSRIAHANFRLAVKLAAGFVALLWFIALLNWGVAPGLEAFGIRPGEWAGLPGILFAPLLHGGFGHLLANSPPLLVLGAAMLYLYPHAMLQVLAATWLGTGVAVWLFASDGVHIGASGLVYGLAAYVFVAGLIRRDRRAIAASLVVAFMYGTLVWGVTPIERGVSWETHLAAALIGIAMAIATRHVDVPPRVRYTWEDESETEPELDSQLDPARDPDPARGGGREPMPGEARGSGPGAAQEFEIGEEEWRVVPPSKTLH